MTTAFHRAFDAIPLIVNRTPDLRGWSFGLVLVLNREPRRFRTDRHAYWRTVCRGCGEPCVQSTSALLHYGVRACASCTAYLRFASRSA